MVDLCLSLYVYRAHWGFVWSCGWTVSISSIHLPHVCLNKAYFPKSRWRTQVQWSVHFEQWTCTELGQVLLFNLCLLSLSCSGTGFFCWSRNCQQFTGGGVGWGGILVMCNLAYGGLLYPWKQCSPLLGVAGCGIGWLYLPQRLSIQMLLNSYSVSLPAIVEHRLVSLFYLILLCEVSLCKIGRDILMLKEHTKQGNVFSNSGLLQSQEHRTVSTENSPWKLLNNYIS